ncbi:MAG: putative toxin-antitoxin system toxin component, PIN family [Proteobacteria bacterium]|nr:putative toxin-antitoxin system toxin component, PIN family [Pseudomonadota bacterium]
MKVFLDTNVLVSAFATRGLCADVFEAVLLEHELLIGRHLLKELDRVLRMKLRLPAARAREIVELVTDEAMRHIDISEPAMARVDPEDARALGEAQAAQAELFVTGDRALLELSSLGELRIVSPRQFWEIMKSATQ